MKKRLIIYICIFQIVVILSILYSIFQHKKILGTVVANPIKNDDVVFDTSGGLKYFYEPKFRDEGQDQTLGSVEDNITINADTLNERFDYEIPKPDGVFRVIALGDSFTYGLYVPTVKNWTELLEDKYKAGCSNKIEVINLGVAGYDTRYELERFVKRGIKYEPDVVIWFFVDLKRDMEEITPIFAKRAPNYDNSSLSHLFDSIKFELSTKKGLQNVYNYQMDSARKFNEYFKKRLLIFYDPAGFKGEEIGLLKQYASERSDPTSYYELEHSPYSDNAKYVIPNDGHPNELGHELIAQDLYKHTVDKAIVKCDR